MLLDDKAQSSAEQIYREHATSSCSVCSKLVDTQVIIRDGAVYFRKSCPQHGTHEALVEADADWYVNVRANQKYPPKAPPTLLKGCQAECGRCVETQNHTCFTIVEITTRCNMHCPICYADSGKGADKSLAEIESILDTLLVQNQTHRGQIKEITISGGEPTIHSQFLEVLDLAASKGFRSISVTSNGRRFVQDPAFTREVAKRNPWIYLSFDTFRESTYERMRGSRDWQLQIEAIDALAKAGINTIGFVLTVVKGMNDDEVGDIVRYALSNPHIGMVSIFPSFYSGRFELTPDALHRSTLTGVMADLESQTNGLFKKSDFYPGLCTPACTACSLVLRDGDRLIYPSRLMDPGSNDASQPIPNDLSKLIEEMAHRQLFGSGEANRDLPCDTCSLDIFMDNRQSIVGRSFGLMIHGQMDKHTFDPERASQCTLHYPTASGRVTPFCTAGIFNCRSQCVVA